MFYYSKICSGLCLSESNTFRSEQEFRLSSENDKNIPFVQTENAQANLKMCFTITKIIKESDNSENA